MSVVFSSVKFVRQRQIENACRVAVHPFALYFEQLNDYEVVLKGCKQTLIRARLFAYQVLRRPVRKYLRMVDHPLLLEQIVLSNSLIDHGFISSLE